MTLKEIKQKLKEIGLSDRESAIYLYLLQNNDQTVFVIAKATNLPRTTVYQTLEYLKQKDLVGIFKKNRVAYWYAENPRRLVKDIEQKSNLAREIFPELESLMSGNNGTQPEVRFYTGKENIKTVILDFYNTLAKQKTRNLYTVSHPALLDAFPRFLPDVLKTKNKLGIFTHLIAPKSAEHLKLPSYSNDELREVRFLDDKYTFLSTMIICEDNVALFSLRDNEIYTMKITSPTFSSMFKSLFLSIWDTLPPTQ
jgi:sugar-specific transcriptional regulator TrmB